jgi:tetratricopeptide (TPR) repeat protein
MPSFSRRFSLCLLLAGALAAVSCLPQQSQSQNPPSPETTPQTGPQSSPPSSAQQGSSSSRVPNLNPTEIPSSVPQVPVQLQKSANPGAPALIDPAGPTVSLETSEAMFDIGVALNACGYDKGLDESEPVRKEVRSEVNQATQASAKARDDRDKLCLFINQHRLDDPARNLAQYVSLALYLTPPPELTPSVEEQDMPPDANAVELILPLLRSFADAINLHLIWAENHAAYDEATSRLHAPLTNMIVSTNYYIKTSASTYSGRRFLVVLEPLLSPEETNARVYGPDYVVVASPKNGQISMDLVRHAYLHYEIEPLLYARENTVDERMLPILKAVEDAPLDFEFKNDIEALVIECMIRAIEARTMDTGIAEVKVPANLPRSEADQYEHARSVALQKQEVVRQQAVNHSMAQGYVLTEYFYGALKTFEKTPEGLNEAIGPMVYGMDVSIETHRARQITFDVHGEGHVMGHSPQRPPQAKDLDVAELKLMKGDVAGAAELAQKALESHSGDAGQANFILARVDLMKGKIDDAQAAFKDTLTASKDPRMLAWSHIYLGRILDVEEQREDALVEYKAALTVRDGQPDTKEAAEAGLKQPFTLPQRAQAPGSDDKNDSAPPPTAPSSVPSSQPHPQ